MRLPVRCKGFNGFSARVASDWELLGSRKYLKRLQQKNVSCGTCGLW